MYKCKKCGTCFASPMLIVDKEPYGEGYVDWVSGSACPNCGGEFEEVYICELCGDTFTKSQHEDVCQSCINIIAKRFSDILNENFTQFEISILNSAYDGRNLE